MKKMFVLIVFMFIMCGVSINVYGADRVCYYKDSTGKNAIALNVTIGYTGMPDVKVQAINGSKFGNYSLHWASEDNVNYIDYTTNCPSRLTWAFDVYNNGYNFSTASESYYYNLGATDVGSLTFSTYTGVQEGANNSNSYVDDDGKVVIDSSKNPNSGNLKPNYGMGILDTCNRGCSGTSECPAIFGSADDPNSILGFMSKYIFTPIRWLTPIIFILLTSIDFAKAIFMDEKDGIGKAKSNFVKRGVAALCIFLAPTIVSILLTLIDGATISRCINANGIGNL